MSPLSPQAPRNFVPATPINPATGLPYVGPTAGPAGQPGPAPAAGPSVADMLAAARAAVPTPNVASQPSSRQDWSDAVAAPQARAAADERAAVNPAPRSLNQIDHVVDNLANSITLLGQINADLAKRVLALEQNAAATQPLAPPAIPSPERLQIALGRAGIGGKIGEFLAHALVDLLSRD